MAANIMNLMLYLSWEPNLSNPLIKLNAVKQRFSGFGISYLSICLNNKRVFFVQTTILMVNNKCVRQFADQAQIRKCKNKLKANVLSFSKLSKVLELAGNEVRLKIVYLQEEENELCPCDLSDILGMSIPAVSQHLRKLKDGNIIESRRDGQTIYYSLKEEHMKVLKPFFRYINQENLKTQTI